MLTERVENKINSRLNGQSEAFLRDAIMFGLDYAIHQYQVSDIAFPDILAWAEKRHPGVRFLSQRGALTDPREPGLQHMEDFLTVILRRFQRDKERIELLTQENKRLKAAIEYHRHNPLNKCHDLMSRVLEESHEADKV